MHSESTKIQRNLKERLFSNIMNLEPTRQWEKCGWNGQLNRRKGKLGEVKRN